MKSLLRFAVTYLMLSSVLGVVALVTSFPARPHSWVGWLSLFALALPVTAAGELLGVLLHRNPIASSVNWRTRDRRFSLLRIGYLLGAGLLVAVAIAGFNILFG